MLFNSGSAVTAVDELGNGGNTLTAVVYQSLPSLFGQWLRVLSSNYLNK